MNQKVKNQLKTDLKKLKTVMNVKFNNVKYLNNKINNISSKLIFLLKKKFPDDPYTLFITRWDDGSFMAEISSSAFDMPQHEAIRQEKYNVTQRIFRYYRGKITYREVTKLLEGNPGLPYAKSKKH